MKRFSPVLLSILLVVCAGLLFFAWQGENRAPQAQNNSMGAEEESDDGTVTVAFIGDQGYGENARAVLSLIKEEGADIVLHQGDLDYKNNPVLWEDQVNSVLGSDFPYLVSIGNHDVPSWPAYERVLRARLARTPEVSCTGDIGVNQSCTFRGLFIALSGIGTQGEGHEEFLRASLAASDATWKICSWHKNQRLMQVGGKKDEVGWEAYDICRETGAIIATGHEHSYSRTHLMENFSTQKIASTDTTLALAPGKSFAFVSGIAGHSIRVQDDALAANPWWASVYTKDQGADYGALLCTFRTDRTASCALKAIDGTVPDSFSLTSAL